MTLLLDALDRTLREAQCAPRWHRLMAIWAETRDGAARASLLETLTRMPEDDARADILRLTFLAGATGESRYEDLAAARVAELEPADPERMAAFMAFRWLNSLQHLERRADFAAAMSAGRLPELAVRLMHSAAQVVRPNVLPAPRAEIERVAVVAPYIGHPLHTPSMLAVEECALLAREGLQVRLFSAQELTPPDASLFRGDALGSKLPPFDGSAWPGVLPSGVLMTIADSRFSLPGRWRNLMPVLADFNPDVVLLVGLYSPLAAALHALRPLVGISVNSVPPIAPLDVWLTADREPQRREFWGGAFLPPQPVYHPYRVKRSGKPFQVTRTELGLADGTVVWVTAGFRLQHEIKEGEWTQRILQLLTRHPEVVWLLVGGDGRLPAALRSAPAGRVRALPTRHDLPGILRCADIYVNPPRMGGGFSVAEAMAEGLPVTSLAGSDGGDKVGEWALSGIDSYIECLSGLSASRSSRSSMGQALRRRFDERFDLDGSGPALLAACRQAAALARARLTEAS